MVRRSGKSKTKDRSGKPNWHNLNVSKKAKAEAKKALKAASWAAFEKGMKKRRVASILGELLALGRPVPLLSETCPLCLVDTISVANLLSN
jgi:hypothetical protein